MKRFYLHGEVYGFTEGVIIYMTAKSAKK